MTTPESDAGGVPAGAPDDQHTVVSVLQGAIRWLRSRGVDAPQRSAELLLGHVLRLSRLELYLAHDRPMGEPERAAMRALLRRRGEGEPVAYLLGSWSFRGLELEVSPAVLVPRPETEELVTLALERGGGFTTVVDLGTGCGAIAIALAVERPDARVTAVDLSENALELARRNAARHGVAERITFVRGSWWEPVPPDAVFDLVVTNPPYVDPAADEALAADVRAYEPPLALFTRPGDPAGCYRDIAVGLPAHLRSGGLFLAETGVGASGPALELLTARPELEAVELVRDEAGIDRYLVALRG